MTRKESQAFKLTIACFLTLAVLVFAVWGVHRYKDSKVFSPPEPVASQVNPPSDTPDAPAHIIISIMDLQREINRRYPDLNLKVDGRYGPLTQAAHEIAIGDQYAKKLMVWEVK